MKKKNTAVLLTFLVSILLSSCATTTTNLIYEGSENQWGNIYSGSHCDIETIKGMFKAPVWLILLPLVAIDLALSFVADTVLLPAELLTGETKQNYYCGKL